MGIWRPAHPARGRRKKRFPFRLEGPVRRAILGRHGLVCLTPRWPILLQDKGFGELNDGCIRSMAGTDRPIRLPPDVRNFGTLCQKNWGPPICDTSQVRSGTAYALK